MSESALPSSLKVAIVGSSSVGKSSIVQRLVDGTFSEDGTTTCGADFYSHAVPIEGGTARLQIWDTAGQERFRSISRAYFRNAVGAVLVFDITRERSFEELEAWLGDIHALACPNCYIILVGNKSDLEAQRQVGAQEVREFSERHGLEYLETSAASGQNIEAAFARLAMVVTERVTSGEIVVVRPQSVPVQKENPKKRKCC